MKKTFIKVSMIFLLIILCINFNVAHASEVIDLMDDTNKMDTTGTEVMKAINSGIGLIQLAGTGIAVFVITVLGIKYMLAAPSEKADVKKNILPIIIGCVLLFGAVNIVALIVDVTDESLGSSGSGETSGTSSSQQGGSGYQVDMVR